MSDSVFLVDPTLVVGTAVDDLITVRGPEARHAVSVVRMQPGDAIDLVDGGGRRVSSLVESASDGDVLVVRVTAVQDEPAPRLRVVVVQAIPKGEHGELAVDLMTQAGVDEIVPWAAQHCVAIWRGDKAEKARSKWQSAAERAAKQSRRARVPQVSPLAATKDVVERIRGSATSVVLHESATRPLASVDLAVAGELLLVIGPEGGISADEREAFTAAGASVALLGPHVLRSSLAGAAAIVAVAAHGSWAAWEDARHE